MRQNLIKIAHSRTEKTPVCTGEILMKITTATIVSAIALSVAAAASAEQVRVYNWSDYIDESLLAKFEEETGIDLIYDVFDSNELLETKMLAGA